MPFGFESPLSIAPGEHVGRITAVEGRSSNRSRNFTLKVWVDCLDGQHGTIVMRFSSRDDQRQANQRNAEFVGTLLEAANICVEPGDYPDWYEVAHRLRNVQFTMQVGASKGGAPFFIRIHRYPDDEMDAAEDFMVNEKWASEEDVDLVEDSDDAEFPRNTPMEDV
jgi:hypothetical protein